MSRPSPLWRYLPGSLFLFAVGGWYLVTQRARFLLGGDENNPRRGINVNAEGLDATAIGVFFVSLGVMNLTLAVRPPWRIPVFCLGLALFLATVFYGLSKIAASLAN